MLRLLFSVKTAAQIRSDLLDETRKLAEQHRAAEQHQRELADLYEAIVKTLEEKT